jgi:predicted membrane protein
LATDDRPGLALTPQTVFGGLIIVWGLILTAENLGWIHSRGLSFWPLVLIALGATLLGRAPDGSARLVASLLLGTGVLITVARLFGFDVDLGDLWPLVLVAIGVGLVRRASVRGESEPGGLGAEQQVSGFVVWSATKRRVTSQMFRRADFNVVMGGVEVDLRPASTAGGEAVIDIFSVMGGIEILVAPDWTVVNQIVGVMASVEDKSTGEPAAKNRLVLRGLAMMSSVEVKVKS